MRHIVFAGPSAFGPDLDEEFYLTEASLFHADPPEACDTINNADEVKGKIVLMQRGGCMFIDKVRVAEKLGAVGAIIYNHRDGDTDKFFTMSGDGVEDVKIPAAFLVLETGQQLVDYLAQGRKLFVSISGTFMPRIRIRMHT